jgi:hypothetical protein
MILNSLRRLIGSLLLVIRTAPRVLLATRNIVFLKRPQTHFSFSLDFHHKNLDDTITCSTNCYRSLK